MTPRAQYCYCAETICSGPPLLPLRRPAVAVYGKKLFPFHRPAADMVSQATIRNIRIRYTAPRGNNIP